MIPACLSLVQWPFVRRTRSFPLYQNGPAAMASKLITKNPKKSCLGPGYLCDELLLDNVPIEIVSEHKVLGVVFNTVLNWTPHVNMLSKSLVSATGALSRCRHFFPENVKLQIYQALFASQINYCTLVWGTTTNTNIHKLLVLQKRAHRIIANVPYLHTTLHLFTKFNIIRVTEVYHFRLLYSYLFSSKKFSLLKSLLGLQRQLSDQRTRSQDKWLVPIRRTNYLMQSLVYNVPSLFNKYENEGVDIYALTRKEMRRHLLFYKHP